MKVIFSLIYSFLSFNTLAIQLDSLKLLNNGFNSIWAPNSYKLSVNGLAESNSFNAGMYNDLLFNSQFTDQHLDVFKENNNVRLNTAIDVNAKLDYLLNSKLGIYAIARNEAVIGSSKEFASLLLFGNREFVDQEIETTDLNLVTSANYTVGLKHKKEFNNGFIVFTTGVGYTNSFNQLSASSLSIFTSSDDYIDLSVQNLEFNTNNNGVYLDFGFEMEQKTSSESRLIISIEDVRPTFLFKDNNRSINSELRFDGFEVNVLNPSLNNLDSNLNDMFNVKQLQNGISTLPARARISAFREFENSELELCARFLYAGFLGYAVEGSFIKPIGDGLALKTGAGYGNFTGLYINASTEAKIGSKTSVFMGLQGINSLVSPVNFTNYGLRFGLSSRLR